MHLLGKCTQGSFNSFLFIFCYLLKLVNGKHDRSLLGIKKCKKGFQRMSLLGRS